MPPWSSRSKNRSFCSLLYFGPGIDNTSVRCCDDCWNPSRRGQALPLRGQGRLLQPHRRLLHRLADEDPHRHHRDLLGGGPTRGQRRRGWLRRALRPRQPVPIPDGSSKRSSTTNSPDQWAASAPPATTPRWSDSSRCCRRTSLNRQRWRTREELRLAIVVWIERTYHRRRRQRPLGKLTPIEFETIYTAAHAA